MGWMGDDNLHEGYLSVVLFDDVVSTGSTAAGPVAMARDDQGNYTGTMEQRSEDEVMAWVLKCDCWTEDEAGEPWTGDRWERVPTPMLDNPEKRRVYLAPDEASADVMNRRDVEAAARSQWLTEHVSPIEALLAIDAAREEIAAATERLRGAVALARASGRSWADVGRAAGMSRQAAQERWGS